MGQQSKAGVKDELEMEDKGQWEKRRAMLEESMMRWLDELLYDLLQRKY